MSYDANRSSGISIRSAFAGLHCGLEHVFGIRTSKFKERTAGMTSMGSVELSFFFHDFMSNLVIPVRFC